MAVVLTCVCVCVCVCSGHLVVRGVEAEWFAISQGDR